MTETIHIERADAGAAEAIAGMVGELLGEIMATTGTAAFRFDGEQTAARLERALERGIYVVFVARDGGRAVGFVTLFESFALYAEGAFGTIPELYVRPDYRSAGIGRCLLARVRAYAQERGWRRLEVTTPPLPTFGRTLSFYQREGFGIAGGRKLKIQL